eukprot:TRINITY_DN2196_c0_g1_i2.p1 TRINITY_DN2196_c0_g1~~TRINITY_DN2196_c0_g1_i2.p1  ORF type:complete len:1242 (-),score=287.64 TRINITY_DN2196_c0_g1_i2:251-3847(-)
MEVASALFRRLDPSGSGLIHEEQVLPLWPALTQHVEGAPIELSEHRQRRGAPISYEEWQSLMSALRSIIGDRRFKSSVKRAAALAAKRSLAGSRVQLPPLASSASAPALLPVPGAIDTSPRNRRPSAGASAAYPSALSMTPMKSVGFAPAPATAPTPPVPAAKSEECLQAAEPSAQPMKAAQQAAEPLLDTSQLSQETTLKPEETTLKPRTPSPALCDVFPDFSSSPMAARRYTQGLSVLGLAVPKDLVDPSTSPPSSPTSGGGPRLQSPTPSRSRSGKSRTGGQTFLNDFSIRSGQSSANPSRNRSSAATPIPRVPSHLGDEVGEEALLSRLKLYESIQEEDEETEGAELKKAVPPQPQQAELDEQVQQAASALAAAASADTEKSSADEARVAEALAAAPRSASATPSGKATQEEQTEPPPLPPAESKLESEQAIKSAPPALPNEAKLEPARQDAPPKSVPSSISEDTVPDFVHQAAAALASAALGPVSSPKRRATAADEARIAAALASAALGSASVQPDKKEEQVKYHTEMVAAALASAIGAAPKTPSSEERPAPPVPMSRADTQDQDENGATQAKAAPAPPPPLDSLGAEVPEEISKAAAALAAAAFAATPHAAQHRASQEARIAAVLAAAAFNAASPVQSVKDSGDERVAEIAAALATAAFGEDPASPGQPPPPPGREEQTVDDLPPAPPSLPATADDELPPSLPATADDELLDEDGMAKSASPPSPPPPGQDEDEDGEQATSKSVVARFDDDKVKEEEDEDEEEDEAAGAGVESDVELEIENAIALAQAHAESEMEPDELAGVAESVAFTRRFRKLKATSGIKGIRHSISKPRPSAPPKYKPVAGRSTDLFDDEEEESGQANDVMGLICRMYSLEADWGDDDDDTEQSAELHGSISPAAYNKGKMRKQRSWHDDMASKFFWDDDEDELKDELKDEVMEPAEEESTELPSTMLSQSRNAESQMEQNHSRSLGSEQVSSSSWDSTGQLPRLIKRSSTAPVSFDVFADENEDEEDIGDILSGDGGSASVKALKSRLREELHMHQQTRVHAEELERKLKLANAKITQGPTVKRESRFGVTNPRPYAGKPMPIPRKNNRGVYLPALKPLKPSSPKRDAGDAVLPVVQSLLEESRMNALSRNEQSRSRVEAFSRLGHVGMSTWNVRRAEKVSRYQDMMAFSESVWGSFYDWNDTYKSTG